jgi:RimJ/RimL family protein N-acetyltransferase
MIQLSTERLLLREPNLADAPAYALGVSEYEVARFLTPVPYPYTLGMAIEWLRHAPAATPEHCLFIIERVDRGLIGCITIHGELGFWIARPYWNQGYVTEAATALLNWHFAAAASQTVLCSAHHNNHASLAVQRKLGFAPSHRERRFSHALQRNVEHVVSSLARDEWQRRSAAA